LLHVAFYAVAVAGNVDLDTRKSGNLEAMIMVKREKPTFSLRWTRFVKVLNLMMELASLKGFNITVTFIHYLHGLQNQTALV